jgi:hypothetical protein
MGETMTVRQTEDILCARIVVFIKRLV